MTLQSSGQISISNIASEFTDSPPYAFSKYYRGGTLVPNVLPNDAITTSGAIAIHEFYGALKRNILASLTLSNGSNYTLTASGITGYIAGVSNIVVNVPSGVTIGAAGYGYAITIDDSFTSGDTITLNNSGNIYGYGGAGDSGSGGPALYVQTTKVNVTVNNNAGGVIAGGGGGGGGGSGLYDPTGSAYTRGGGGGGGQGYSGGTGGAVTGSISGPSNYYHSATAGSAGSSTGAGSGGIGDYGHHAAVAPDSYWSGGSGGSGGGFGQAGSAGTTGNYSGQDFGGGPIAPGTGPYPQITVSPAAGAGGAAGSAIKGVGHYTLTNNGTLYGSQTT